MVGCGGGVGCGCVGRGGVGGGVGSEVCGLYGVVRGGIFTSTGMMVS